MPPPEDGAAARRAVSPTPLDALSLSLSLRILALLPADARLLAAAVCRSWRTLLADAALWTRLDLSPRSGVANPRSMPLLRASAARAGGQLEVLRVYLESHQPVDELLTVLAANAGTLRVLELCKDDTHIRRDDSLLDLEVIGALLRAAPGLQLLEAGVECTTADAARRVLRKEPPFGPLRLTTTALIESADLFYDWRTLAGDLAMHTSLEMLYLLDDWPEARAASDALVGTLLSLPLLRELWVTDAPPSVIARLLSCPALTVLAVDGTGGPLLDTPASATLLCDALRANTRLRKLMFRSSMWWDDIDAATEVLATLQAHPASLQELHLCFDEAELPPEHAAAAGAAIGAVVAHSPALAGLRIVTNRDSQLGDIGLGPIVDALPHARCLHSLQCRDDGMSEAFARVRLLPAVRACAPLRYLSAGDGPAVREARTLLQQRR